MRSREQSASSLKTLELCELKYFRTYEEKYPKLVDPDHATSYGTSVHYALEKLYKDVYKNRSDISSFTNDEQLYVYERFMEKAAETKVNDIKLLEEGKTLLKTYMNRFDFREKCLDLEKKFKLDTPAGTMFGGYIDKVVELAPDTIAVVDYKTSRFAMTREEADSDIQLSMYDLAASILWPGYSKIILVLDYLRLTPVVSYRTPEQREVFRDFLDSTEKYIVAKKKEDIKPTLNSLCGWCAFKDVCPDFIKATRDVPEGVGPISVLSNDEIIGQWQSLKSVSKATESALRVLKLRMAEISRDSGGEIVGTKNRMYSTQIARVNYDVEALRGIIPDDELLSMCSINKSSIDRYVAGHPDKEKEIKKTSSVHYASSYFSVSKK
jgi:putative RecB family exonuclease